MTTIIDTSRKRLKKFSVYPIDLELRGSGGGGRDSFSFGDGNSVLGGRIYCWRHFVIVNVKVQISRENPWTPHYNITDFYT